MNRLVFQNGIQYSNQFKKIVYDYDLISGKVNKVSYQPGEYDSYYHRYEYDGENRLTDVYSGRDEIMLNLFKEKEAHYNYYKHGLLASTTLGQLMVQKQDYAYTLHGWLKAVNPAFGGTLANGTNTTEAGPVAQDVYGFSLHYFDNDYNAIGYTPQSNSILGSLGTKAVSLYNGNIAAMAVNLPGVGVGASKVYNYHYDQLNRIVAMDAYEGLDVSSGKFTLPSTQPEEYKERISYDANGNILSYLRNGDASRLSMDNLTYHYIPGTNKLHKVTDAADDASDANYSKYNDLRKNMPGQNTPAQNDNNYEYDLIGNLVKDHSENLEITWNSYGKIASINKSGVVTKFAYDASGNRILKETPSGSTAYVRDASGNVLSVYIGGASGNVSQSEVHLYGSSRLGIVSAPGKQNIDVPLGCGFSSGINSTFTRGEKLFELSNHLGNVLTTVTDKRIAIPQAGNAQIDHYVADIASAQDYYPFGMIMPGRKVNASGYRYGFNGKENDNDVKGEGNQQDYGMRVYDPRIGKFLSVDPITRQYPELTPYQFSSNNPIQNIDIDGLEGGASNGAPTTTNLYHVTAAENAESIIKSGFNATENGKYSRYSWFSPKSSAGGTGVQFDPAINVEIQTKGVDTKNAYVITESKVLEIEQDAHKAIGNFKSLDEAKEGLSSKQYRIYRQRFYGTKYNLLGQFMNKLGKPSYYLATEGTFAISDAALKGKVQFWGFKGNVGNLAKGLNGLKIAGKTLLVVGVAKDVYEIATSQNVAKTITKKVGGWAGATVMAEGGAGVGAWIGGWGAIPGAIIGGVVGYMVGEKVTETIYERLETKGWVPAGKE